MKFALENLLRKRSSFLLLSTTITVSFCICQIFLGFLDHPYLSIIDTQGYAHMLMGSFITLIIIFMSCFLLVYTSQYFIISRSQELGLMKSFGMTLKKTSFYLLCQSTLMFIVFGVLGIMISFGIYPFISYLIYLYNHQFIVEALSLSSVKENIGLFVTMYMIIIVMQIGYVYRQQLNKLLNNTLSRNKSFHLASYLYPVIYIIGYIMMLMSENSSVGYVFYACICSLSSYGIMKQLIPEMIEKKKSLQSSQMIIYGHLRQRLKEMSLFICMVFLIATIFIAFICSNAHDPKEQLRALLGFIVAYIFIISSLTCKNYLSIEHHIHSLIVLDKLGMKVKDIQKMIWQELMIFYAILIALPFVYIITILLKYYIYHQIHFSMLVFVVVYFIGLLVLSFMIIYILSLKKARKVIWKS